MKTPIIEIHNLSYNYSRKNVLKDINLIIEEGMVYGLIGANGAGKTTLLKIVLGLLTPNEGKISCFGKSVINSRIKILKRIGSCIEHPSLYEHLTALDNLKIYSIYHEVKESRIQTVLNLVKLWESKNKKVKEFSMGMKQKLVLAISLLHDPDLLILDEPTNGLDPKANLEMIMLLKDLNVNYHKSIVISSHKLNDLEKICTHIGLLEDERLIYNDVINNSEIENFDLETFYLKTSNK